MMIRSLRAATCGETMALNIRNRETEALATELASLTGETKTDAVRVAVAERLERVRHLRRRRSLLQELNRIADHCSSLPVLDQRGADEILGYDANGVPR